MSQSRQPSSDQIPFQMLSLALTIRDRRIDDEDKYLMARSIRYTTMFALEVIMIQLYYHNNPRVRFKDEYIWSMKAGKKGGLKCLISASTPKTQPFTLMQPL
jgi:hypothetical protein